MQYLVSVTLLDSIQQLEKVFLLESMNIRFNFSEENGTYLDLLLVKRLATVVE